MNSPVPEQVRFMLSGWGKDSYVFKIKFDFSTCFSRNEVPFEGCALPWLVSIMPDCLHRIQLIRLAFHLCLLLMSPRLWTPPAEGTGAPKPDGLRASSLFPPASHVMLFGRLLLNRINPASSFLPCSFSTHKWLSEISNCISLAMSFS